MIPSSLWESEPLQMFARSISNALLRNGLRPEAGSFTEFTSDSRLLVESVCTAHECYPMFVSLILPDSDPTIRSRFNQQCFIKT